MLPCTAESIDYQSTIQPILAEHCFQCHGPDQAAREADLRLEIRKVAVSQLPSEAVPIVPGVPEESEMIRRITSADVDIVMPPPHFEKPLTPEKIATLRKWVAEGANYREHWGFLPPERAAIPVDEPGAHRNPIDHLVIARLQREGLSLSPAATPAILCRRIHLDLVGLPPSPGEVDAFVQAAEDNLSAAVESEVKRLLESPHYGEKWARHWLDVARYADSNGYEKDLPREQWNWRDWVIQAINADMPYDQFLVEQIAGDLLPDATQDQVVATGFLRNSMLNEEGAIVPEQFRMEGMFDRIDCIGKAVLGLTLQCAPCHSHKYDPISQDEYYGMMAFLNNANDAQSWVYTAEQLRKIDEVESGLREIYGRIKAQRPDWQAELGRWERVQLRATAEWEILDTFDETWVGGSNHPEKLPDCSVCVLGHPSAAGDMYVRANCDLKGVTGLRFEALTYGDLPFGGPGRSITGAFAISELTVQVKLPDVDQWVDLPLRNVTADFSSQDRLLASFAGAELAPEDKRIMGPVQYLIDGNIGTAWHSDRGPGRRNAESVAVVQFAEPLDYPPGTQLQIRLAQHHAPTQKKRGVMIVGRFRVAVTRSPDPRAPDYDYAATLALETPVETRTAAQQAEIFKAWLRSLPEKDAYHAEREQLWQQYPDDPPTSVLTLSTREQPLLRTTLLLDRGVWDKPLHPVEPHVPSALHPLSPSNEPDRLRFARWLADPRSPLTARVQVNRVWQAIFGVGLLETSEDYGTRAPQPEYLDLFDHLAVDFMEHQWSQKWLLREILTSKVYQQSSHASPALLKQDPRNRLLARGSRFRAEAEVVRDIALTVSGLLQKEVGGASFFPPVPESVINYNFVVPDYWKPAEPPTRYRRSLYMFRKRSMPDPVLSTFDAPNGETACARRIRSNTSLAALIPLNEPVFVEAARALALRVLNEGGTREQDRADYLFRLCTSRSAKPEERKELLALIENQRPRLAEGWLSINELATGNASQLPNLPPNTSPQDVAAWVIAARVVLNLDATLSKN